MSKQEKIIKEPKLILEVTTAYGTHYEIDEHGCFLKYDEHKWNCPHDSWKCVGVAELLPFGNFRFHNLSSFIGMIKSGQSFRFKNGNPKYTIVDLDHGTKRIHGNTKYHGIAYATLKKI